METEESMPFLIENQFRILLQLSEQKPDLLAESGIMPTISVKIGSGQKIVSEFLADHPEVGALVLGAAKGAAPGPLVTHFSAAAGSLPCPLYIIPADYDETKSDHGA